MSMFKDVSLMCVIPARAGSQRIPRKNLAKLDGLTLVEHAYKAAEDANIFATIVVSTDDERMACGLPWVERPEELSGPDSDISDAVWHAHSMAEARNERVFDYVVTLQPAVPLRTADLIKRLVNRVIDNACKGGVTGVELVPWIWRKVGTHAFNDWYPDPYPRSQEFEGTKSWQEINAVQVSNRECVVERRRWGLPLAIELLPSYAVLDIDSPSDLERAQKLFGPLMKLLKADNFKEGFVVSSINERN